MTIQDMRVDIMALLEHAKQDLEVEYPTSFTTIVSERIMEAVEEKIDSTSGLTLDDTTCREYLESIQNTIRDKAEELAKLLRLHSHGKYTQQSARDIGRSMSAVLGHNSRSIIRSCTAFSV